MEEKRISPIKRVAISLLDKVKEQIITDCDDTEVINSLQRFHPENNGFFKEDDYITADVAMKILHLGYNRNKFFALVKEHNIINHKINNQHIGFKRSEIEALKDKI